MPPIRVAILSDDRLLSEGLLRIMSGENGLTTVGYEEEAVWRPALRSTHPDVVLLDSRMQGALDLCAVLKRDGGPAVIFVGARDDDEWARGVLEAGARGILAKSAGVEDLVKAIRVVHDGQIWARRHVIVACMESLAAASAGGRDGEILVELQLSRREWEIFRQAATGLSNKELAARLAISEATVKAHLTRIFQKLGLRGRAELAAMYHGVAVPASAPRAAGPDRRPDRP
jgi:DNA-binding NarL/FixJ family response regulator